MYLEESDTKKKVIRVGAVIFAMLLLFVVAFFTEIAALWGFVTGLLTQGDLPQITAISFARLTFTCAFGFLLVAVVWMVLVSAQTILPVRNFQEVMSTVEHLLLYMRGQHGPAVFIKDGAQEAAAEELKRRGPGVAAVDFNSAMVLEERIPAPGSPLSLGKLLARLQRWLGPPPAPSESPRAVGPGIVFLRPRERIRGIVDLRIQTRSQNEVKAYTRDGIEISSSVSAAFTIGQDPNRHDVLQVTYAGERLPENLRIITLKDASPGILKVSFEPDLLDAPDRNEIHERAQQTGPLLDYVDLPEPEALPVFDPERVFAAVSSETRGTSEKGISWTDLPLQVAVELFRAVISQANYEDFYAIDQPGYLPLPEFKRQLNWAVRSVGLLSYRLVFHRTRRPLEPGVEYPRAELRTTEVRSLKASKVLRDRGIRVISSGFGDLNPVSDKVYQQRLDSWRARLERETNMVQATHELEAMRTRSRARAEAQKDLVFALSEIFRRGDPPQEVIALRVFQALEAAAAEPGTQRLLPANTIEQMRTIHDWLLPGENKP